MDFVQKSRNRHISQLSVLKVLNLKTLILRLGPSPGLSGFEKKDLLNNLICHAEECFSGDLMDGAEALKWMLTHLESAEIEEVSNSMLGRLIRDTRNIVVIFCKYIAYAVIALTHTCYLIKNYQSDHWNQSD